MNPRLEGSMRVYQADRRRQGERFEAEGMTQVIQTWKCESALSIVACRQIDMIHQDAYKDIARSSLLEIEEAGVNLLTTWNSKLRNLNSSCIQGTLKDYRLSGEGHDQICILFTYLFEHLLYSSDILEFVIESLLGTIDFLSILDQFRE